MEELLESYQLTATYQTLSQNIDIEVFPQSLVSSMNTTFQHNIWNN